jgi:hypothetical protein
MLRTIRTAKNNLVIKGFKCDTTDPGSFNLGSDDASGITQLATGRAKIDYYDALCIDTTEQIHHNFEF